jgi:hypothetical protein
VELQVHGGEVSVVVGHSLVPAVPESGGPADVEVLVLASEIVSLGQHVVVLDVRELGQAEVTVHDVADVGVRPSYFFLI